MASRNQAVTYRHFADLALFQSRIVDRESDETIRAVPPDQRIELAQRFQKYVGQRLDALA